MTAFRVEHTREFEKDYDAALSWQKENVSSRAAAKLIEEVDDAVARILAMPYMIRVSDKPAAAAHSIRAYPISRFVLLYRIVDGRIILMRFFSQAQDYEALL